MPFSAFFFQSDLAKPPSEDQMSFNLGGWQFPTTGEDAAGKLAALEDAVTALYAAVIRLSEQIEQLDTRTRPGP
jgi:hypothetical protein